MPVTVIQQSTTTAARTNWIVGLVIKYTRSKIAPSPDIFPHDVLQSKPWFFERSFNVSVERIKFDDLPATWQHRQHWCPVYVKRKASQAKRVIIYYHGGGFVNMMANFQWNMIGTLAHELEADIVIQSYILTPHGGVHDNIDHLVHLYDKCREIGKKQGQEVILCGDSAGGGITAAMLLALNDKKLPLPDQAIMLAPVLVIDIDTPENRAIEPVDPMLKIDRLSAAFRAWTTGRTELANLWQPAPPPTPEELTAMKHPYASPSYGKWEFAAKAKLPITISQGTHDLLLPQVDQFVEDAKALELNLTYIRAEGAAHVYPVFGAILGASFIAPDSIEGMKLIVESVKRYSKV